MKLFLKLNKAYTETTVTVESPEMDDEVKQLIEYIHSLDQQFLIGKKEEMQHILKPADIHYFHTEKDGVVAVTSEGSFKLKEKLYELEDILPSNKFIRLSKSVIANLHEMSRFEASFNGTLCVYFKSGAKEYVSRTYVNAIKEALKMNRRNSI